MSQAKLFTISLGVTTQDGFHRSCVFEAIPIGSYDTDKPELFWMQLLGNLTGFLITHADAAQVSSRFGLPNVLDR